MLNLSLCTTVPLQSNGQKSFTYWMVTQKFVPIIPFKSVSHFVDPPTKWTKYIARVNRSMRISNSLAYLIAIHSHPMHSTLFFVNKLDFNGFPSSSHCSRLNEHHKYKSSYLNKYCYLMLIVLNRWADGREIRLDTIK